LNINCGEACYILNVYKINLPALRRFLVARFFVGLLLLAGGGEARAQVVTDTADSGGGTLRQAITTATNGAVITFAPNLSGQTILLASSLTINTNLTIDASGLTNGIQINGSNSFTIFIVASGTTNVLNLLTLTNGYNAEYGGGVSNSGTLTMSHCMLSGNIAGYGGGGIFNNSGTLTLNQCTLSSNNASDNINGGGGGIYNASGTLTLNACTLLGNSAGYGGGGINNEGGTVTVNGCTLSGNNSTVNSNAGGGGIYNNGLLTLNQCTLSGNGATFGSGGGIYNVSGTLTVNECTLSGNGAYFFNGGGGIANNGTLRVNQSTLSGNSANGLYGSGGGGGGILNSGGMLTITNTIVAGNSAGGNQADIYNDGALTYGGANLVQLVYNYYTGSTITGTIPTNAAPNLAALGNYGGPTQTMPPLPGSPAIGSGSMAANTFATDQRGYPRTQNGRIDIGAMELPTVKPFTANPTNWFVLSSVQFNSTNVDSDGSAITQWNWNFNDSTTSTAQSPLHVYTTAGSFFPGLTVTNNLGLALAVSGPAIFVSPPPAFKVVSQSKTNLTLNGSNGVSGLTYYVLMSSDLTMPRSEWTPVATNLWSTNGSFTFTLTNAVNKAVPKQFYLLQVP
jgi:PKD repeat protein